MTAYNVRVNVTIQQAERTDGMYLGPNSYLNYSTDWVIEGENLADIVNKSINQTLSRTILTAGLTFHTVLALFLFGGEVLHGFSLALVIGILIGTYSSIAIAAPILVAYQDWRTKRGQKPISMPLRAGAGTSQPKEKVKV